MKNIRESYMSEVDLMYDYEKIFKKKGWNVRRLEDRQHTLSAMNISVYKNVADGQICFYIRCSWGVDDYGDYYLCQIDDCSDARYDYNAVNYNGFDISGRGFMLYERNQEKFCKYLEMTLDEIANMKVEVVESKSIKESNGVLDKVNALQNVEKKLRKKYPNDFISWSTDKEGDFLVITNDESKPRYWYTFDFDWDGGKITMLDGKGNVLDFDYFDNLNEIYNVIVKMYK